MAHTPLGEMFKTLGALASVVSSQGATPQKRMKPGSSPLSACTPCGASQRIESASIAFGLQKAPPPRKRRAITGKAR